MLELVYCVQARIRQISNALKKAELPFGPTQAEPKELETYEFKKDPKDYNVYWDVRKGLIPIVGAAREPGVLPDHHPVILYGRRRIIIFFVAPHHSSSSFMESVDFLNSEYGVPSSVLI